MSVSKMDLRIQAKEFAKEMMQTLQVPQADAPYIEAVLVEAALFEYPMKELSIALNQIGDFYNITIKGYQNLIDLIRWVNIFLGKNRHEMLCHVTHTYVQLTEKGAIMVIQMEKIEFRTATSASDHMREREPAIKPKGFRKRQ